MLHHVMPVGPLACNCSILADEAARVAIVVDPGDEIEAILAFLIRHGLTLQQIYITHAHIDHIGGAMQLKAATGAPILMHGGDQMQLPMLDMQAQWIGMALPGAVAIDHCVKDMERVKAGAITGTVLHTPGHTEGSSCLYLPEEQKLLAGDTLFAGSVGRTDLPGGNFETLMRSLRTTVLELADEVRVTPGHGPETSIGEERASNPFLTDDRHRPRLAE